MHVDDFIAMEKNRSGPVMPPTNQVYYYNGQLVNWYTSVPTPYEREQGPGLRRPPATTALHRPPILYP